MKRSEQPTGIRIGKIIAEGNGSDGIRIEGRQDFQFGEVRTAENKGKGINILEAGEGTVVKRWYERPLWTWILGIVGMIIAGVVVWIITGS